MNRAKMLARMGEIQTRRDEIKALGDAATEADATEFKALLTEQEKIKADIDVLDRSDAMDAFASTPAPLPKGVIVGGPVAETSEYGLGEYLKDIAMVTQGRERPARFDNLQKKFKAAATGMSEAVPSDGGFLVGTDMVATLIEKTYGASNLAQRCQRNTITTNSNSMSLNGVDESSRATGSRFGGIQGYWEDEADTINASKPKFNKVDLKLKKVTAAYYATDEVLEDAPMLESKVNDMVSQELAFLLDDALVRGSGAGKPQGFLSSLALVTVTKQTGQPADTVKYENIRDMYAQMWGPSRKNAIWLANDETLPQLMDMVKMTGTTGVPVWLPANFALNQPYDSILGRPIIYPEQMSALGDLGDIAFVDFSQMQLIDKGGIKGASSIHVKFLQSEQVFRFVYRVDAQGLWKSALTPYKGAKTKSPFVTLAARD